MSEMKTRCCTKADSAAVEAMADDQIISTLSSKSDDGSGNCSQTTATTCPSCGHAVEPYGQGQIQEFPWMPYGVKFDPTDREILVLLEQKVMEDGIRLHPLIDQLFIPTLEGDSGICCTHPEMLPGVRKDGQARHFFHRPSKAYTTGTRMRRKVHAGVSTEGETRWHKTGKTRPIVADGKTLGFKKILVLYTNFGRQRKPEKANWVMHQYHLGDQEDEKEGELVVSKVFYQTQPRQCASARNSDDKATGAGSEGISYDEDDVEMITSPGPQQLIPNPVGQQQDEPLFSQFVGDQDS